MWCAPSELEPRPLADDGLLALQAKASEADVAPGSRIAVQVALGEASDEAKPAREHLSRILQRDEDLVGVLRRPGVDPLRQQPPAEAAIHHLVHHARAHAEARAQPVGLRPPRLSLLVGSLPRVHDQKHHRDAETLVAPGPQRVQQPPQRLWT